MAKKGDSPGNRPKQHQALSRRDFVTTGVAAGLGATVLTGAGAADAQISQPSSTTAEIKWDYEADVVVIGSGATGMPAAIRARDLGASVIVVEQNFDVGGKMLWSGGQTSLGGGDACQLRDLAGESDPEGFVTSAPLHSREELMDSPDLLFKDHTDWSITDASAQAPYRYNEPDLHRSYADNAPATRQFLMDNYVRFTRITGTHSNGGMSRARRAHSFLMLGATTDIKAGTVSAEDAGERGRSSRFSPRPLSSGGSLASPGAMWNGSAMTRCLEFSAKEKGVQFILNRHMDEMIREQPFSGRVLGIKASYSPRLDPNTGIRLEPYWANGIIDERRETIYIRARKAVIIGSGGHAGNPEFRSMFYPAWREPAYAASAWTLLGDRGADASGIIAAMRVGANLAGMQQNLGFRDTFHFTGLLATRDTYRSMAPGHPTFPFRGSEGIPMGGNSFQNVIVVNQVGKRFFNELQITNKPGGAWFPASQRQGLPKAGLEHVPCDWRNASVETVRANYNNPNGLAAAMAINEGSTAPDFLPGPFWAIFDRAAVERGKIDIEYPKTSPTNGYFFTADTIEELAAKIQAGNEFQRIPLKYLTETVARWNASVDVGREEEFGRGDDAPMHKIDTPPFYAASLFPCWHDSYGGIRINGKAQAVDMQGQVIPGLYAGGEASGGGQQHGLGRALVHGFIAGTNAAREDSHP
jgi:hypothetical protein